MRDGEEREIVHEKRGGKGALFGFCALSVFHSHSYSVSPLSVDKQCFVGSETGLLLFLLSNLWLSVAARQVLLAGVRALCYHLQPPDKHLILAS